MTTWLFLAAAYTLAAASWTAIAAHRWWRRRSRNR
jgi:hypothetical protein